MTAALADVAALDAVLAAAPGVPCWVLTADPPTTPDVSAPNALRAAVAAAGAVVC